MRARFSVGVAAVLAALTSPTNATAQPGAFLPGGAVREQPGAAVPTPLDSLAALNSYPGAGGRAAEVPAGRGLLQQSNSTTGEPEPFTPVMLGDFVGPRFNMFSDVKIAEGESPRPMSRVFYKFNYYNNLDNTRLVDPLERVRNFDLYRNVFGFERAFFDNTVSLGLRVPFNTLDAQGADPLVGPGGILPATRGYTTTQFGNLSAVVKALLWEDRGSGSLLSGGATVSFPTASSKKINPGMSTVAFAQPFVGYIAQRGDFFVQGFSSVTLSIASAQSIVLFNDIGLGYYAYRTAAPTALLTAVVPTLELHVFTPLRQADPGANLFGTTDDTRLYDIVNVTGGATIEFSHRTTLGVGVAVPVTGPHPFDVEALAQLNYRF
jgi:hypothetical protein